MLAVVGTSFGSTDSFKLAEVETPMPGPGQVRVRIEAAALGFVDGLIMQGRYQLRPPLPYTPGGEISGVVDMVAPDVQGLGIGARVATWQLGGGLAQYVVVDAGEVDVLPDHLDSATAAAMLVDYQTAHYALFGCAKLQAGEKTLVLGAGGAVGLAAVQLAARTGSEVFAAASTPAKRDLAIAWGASQAVDYTQPNWRDSLKTGTPRGGIDVVVDTVGGEVFNDAFRSLAKAGRYLVVGFAAGAIPALPLNLALLKSASLIGVDVRHWLASEPERARRVRRSLFASVANGQLRAPQTVTFPLSDGLAALEATTTRDKAGKVVVLAG